VVGVVVVAGRAAGRATANRTANVPATRTDMPRSPHSLMAQSSRWALAGLVTLSMGQVHAQSWEFSIPRADGSWSGPLAQSQYSTARLQLRALCDPSLAERSGRPTPTDIRVATFAPLASSNTPPDNVQEVSCPDVQANPGLLLSLFPKPARTRAATAPAINLWD
jgi:hypothetical protein